MLDEARAAADRGSFALAKVLYRRALAARPAAVIEELGLAGAMIRHGRPFLDYGLRIRQREHAWFNPTSIAIGRRHGCFAGLTPDAPDSRWHCCPHWPRKYEGNKLLMRTLAERCGVPVPKLYFSGPDIDAVPFRDLPETAACKLSDGAGGSHVLLLRGDEALLVRSGERIARAGVRDVLRRWRAAAPHTHVIVEALQMDEADPTRRAVDHKLLVFGGRVALLRSSDKGGGGEAAWRIRFLTRDWTEFPWPVRANLRHDGQPIPRPRCLEAMIECAERLGSVIGGPVSIDMYATPDGPVLGELTNHPGNGNGLTPEGSRLLGELWEIYEDFGAAAPRFPCEVSGRELARELGRRVRRRLLGR